MAKPKLKAAAKLPTKAVSGARRSYPMPGKAADAKAAKAGPKIKGKGK